MDFTPGALTNANKESWRWNIGMPMSEGTRCHQLAMYVIYESPLQMLCDSPLAIARKPTP
jgi:alpha-glucosidase